MLLSYETLEAVKKRIINNKKIMELMNLPVIKSTDSESIKNQKINQVINKAITTTAQSPRALGERVVPIQIDGITYDKYEEIRITLSILQSNTLSSAVFGNPRLEINVYYDNNRPKNALKLIDEISNEFSGKDISVIWEEDGKEYVTQRELECEGMITQSSNINNYERVGIRFNFFASHYVPYH